MKLVSVATNDDEEYEFIWGERGEEEEGGFEDDDEGDFEQDQIRIRLVSHQPEELTGWIRSIVERASDEGFDKGVLSGKREAYERALVIGLVVATLLVFVR